MPYLNAEDRERRLLEDLARIQRVLDAGAITPRQHELAHARIEAALADGADATGDAA